MQEYVHECTFTSDVLMHVFLENVLSHSYSLILPVPEISGSTEPED